MAAGAGLSIKLRKTDQVTLCFIGDGATNQGIFHESLNMVGTWRLPVVYIVENNLYGMSVSVKRASALTDLSTKAGAYNMTAVTVDGQDVLAVKEAVDKYVKDARAGKGPGMVVCNTYRYYGHSRSDPRVYRTKEEEKYWAEQDPIKLFSAKCVKEGLLSEKDVSELDKFVENEIEEATKFAIESPLPNDAELYTDLFA